MEEEKTPQEQKVRRITHLYYSNKDIQKAIFEFSKNREVVPRYFEGFGKRPDSLQYPGDIFESVKKGATSFHSSQEIWKDPLEISTGMNESQLNNIRSGWDLLIDIDSRYIDYSKIMAEIIIKMLKFHGIKNVGVKFSVPGDTPLLIEKNNEIFLLSILEVINLIKKGEELNVLSLDKNRKLKFSKIYDFLEHKDTLYEIKHSQSTIPLKATKHHSVFIWDKGNIIQKKVSGLKKGDFLISYNSKENPFAKENTKIFNKFEFGSNQFTKKNIKKIVKITPELMRLIGYFLAEGHVTNIINQVGFTFNTKEFNYINDVKKLLKKITNRKISLRNPNPNSLQILIHSKEWATFFDTLCGKKKDKHIPSFVFTSSKKLFLELLKGYFRGDGYKIGKYGIVVKSVSKKLITEFVWLCKMNGISCNLSYEQGKSHKMPQGNLFKGSLVYLLTIPKSELSEILEFHRKRNKFSPFAGDKIFPVDGLKEVYTQIKPKMFNNHRSEQMTLTKKRANLNRIRKVLDWFYEFKSAEINGNSKKILSNYEKLFDSDISLIEVKGILKKGKDVVYDVSVEETEAFFGNYYPLLLHNSGSKGFHLIIPCKAFPKEINGVKTSDMFPEWPRIITKYVISTIHKEIIEKLSELSKPNKYIKDFEASKEVMPDLILVSPRHLFRTPYSLHEKTSLASVVINPEEISKFELKNADPLKVKIKNFLPDSKEGEAKELLTQALDWYKNVTPEKSDKSEKREEFKPIKLEKISDSYLPPSIRKILEGVGDGRKRSLFILLNLFRSIGMEKDEIEKRIYEWNKKNSVSLKEGYIKSQLDWSYRNKIVLPPNYDKDHYKAIGVIPTGEELRLKNPVNFMVRKSQLENKKSPKNKDNFKNKE